MKSGVTTPIGFRAGGIHCGVKPDQLSLDLAAIVSERPAVAAALFTTNQARSGPVIYSESILPTTRDRARAVLINSGNSNSMTVNAVSDARKMGEEFSAIIGAEPDGTLVASTGVIGEALQIESILAALDKLNADLDMNGSARAARAIMTTDRFPKETSRTIQTKPGATYSIGGIAKGAGMIDPAMATMIAVITTDAPLDPRIAQAALKTATKNSFNKISVDGDMSVSDTVFLLANGAADVEPIRSTRSARYKRFLQALTEVSVELAQMIVRDGEGATKFCSVRALGAKRAKDAERIARSIARSNLVKTALFGEDPNWGRIVSAAGAAAVKFDQNRISISLCGIEIFRDGALVDRDWEKRLAALMKRPEIEIEVDLKEGSAEASIWTSDLSYEYVKINASYRT